MLSEYPVVFSQLLAGSKVFSFSQARLIKNAKTQHISVPCHCWLLEHELTHTTDFEDTMIESVQSGGKRCRNSIT